MRWEAFDDYIPSAVGGALGNCPEPANASISNVKPEVTNGHPEAAERGQDASLKRPTTGDCRRTALLRMERLQARFQQAVTSLHKME
jgi:hypothetical protein